MVKEFHKLKPFFLGPIVNYLYLLLLMALNALVIVTLGFKILISSALRTPIILHLYNYMYNYNYLLNITIQYNFPTCILMS